MSVVVSNRQRAKKINTRLLREVTGALLSDLEIKNAEMGINLVAAREITLINETFLKHEGSTDVITFDYAIPATALAKSRGRTFTKKNRAFTSAATDLHGEIFICVDEAVSQAKKFRTSWQSEIVRYIVHGVLHLLGHDDLKQNLRRRMKREENRLLRRLSGKFSLAQIAGRSKISA